MIFFRLFCLKIGSTRLYPRKFRGFVENWKMSFDYSVIQISMPTNLMCLRLKLASKICQELGSFDGKNDSKSAEDALYSTHKTTTFKEKQETLFFITKIEIPVNFMRLRLETSENVKKRRD